MYNIEPIQNDLLNVKILSFFRVTFDRFTAIRFESVIIRLCYMYIKEIASLFYVQTLSD